MMLLSADHLGLVLLGDGSGRPITGVYAVRGRLPAMWRWPSESERTFARRVLRTVNGFGRVWVLARYDAPSMKSGPSAEVEDTGRIERENAVVRGVSKW